MMKENKLEYGNEIWSNSVIYNFDSLYPFPLLLNCSIKY